ncbi:MAG: hypothetical protein EAY75_18105 [Bacteroidetes bacterium]|nr:MAG: hypothetical protein EAY75_18105 [Bacteroidota bacterium]
MKSVGKQGQTAVAAQMVCSYRYWMGSPPRHSHALRHRGPGCGGPPRSGGPRWAPGPYRGGTPQQPAPMLSHALRPMAP